jgi:hypothetical protein
MPSLSPLAFYGSWLASGADFLRLYWCIWLPLYYVFGVMYVLLKLFVLNPPFLSCLLSELHFEVDAPFPGDSAAERLSFAKQWYSLETRPAPYTRSNVRSRFTYLPRRGMWMERFAVFFWLILPAQSAPAAPSVDAKQWYICARWWTPHALCGSIVAGENPQQTGWLITGRIQCWRCLQWLYRWLVVRVLEGYAEEMAAVAPLDRQRSHADRSYSSLSLRASRRATASVGVEA